MLHGEREEQVEVVTKAFCLKSVMEVEVEQGLARLQVLREEAAAQDELEQVDNGRPHGGRPEFPNSGGASLISELSGENMTDADAELVRLRAQVAEFQESAVLDRPRVRQRVGEEVMPPIAVRISPWMDGAPIRLSSCFGVQS